MAARRPQCLKAALHPRHRVLRAGARRLKKTSRTKIDLRISRPWPRFGGASFLGAARESHARASPFGVTAQPTAEWIANQLTAACGWEQIPRDLIPRSGCLLRQLISSSRSLARHSRLSDLSTLTICTE